MNKILEPVKCDFNEPFLFQNFVQNTYQQSLANTIHYSEIFRGHSPETNGQACSNTLKISNLISTPHTKEMSIHLQGARV